MTGINGIQAYQQAAQAGNSTKSKTEYTKAAGTSKATGSSKAAASDPAKETSASKVETKAWNPVSAGSSLVPKVTDYGYTIGNVELSDKAADYYKSLKSKFSNMDFIVVSKDMKATVQQNAAAYGNARRQVVLIDEEKLEKMATDEDYRNKYEGIIAMSQAKLTQAKNSLASSGAGIKNFGMSVSADGTETYFATVEKSTELQKERIEKKAEEKRELRAREKKEAQKEAQEERIEKGREKRRAEKEEFEEELENIDDDREYVTIEAGSLDELFNKVQTYSYDIASARVMTDAEKALGTQIDFKG